MSSLFKSKPAKTTSTSTVTLPDWLESAYKSLVGEAQTASNMGLSEQEQSVIDLLTSDAFKYQPQQDTAISSTQSLLDKALAGGPTTGDIQSGMNPYLDLILNRQRDEATTSFYKGLQDLQDREQTAGAFGGSRSAVSENILRDNAMDDLAKLQEQGLFNAFETSRNQYNINTQNAMQNALSLSNLGTAGLQNMLTGSNALASAGAMPRNLEQGNVSFLNSVIAPAAQSMRGETTESVQSGGGGSLFSKILGAGLSIAGMATGNPMAAMGGNFIGSLFGGGGVSPTQLSSGALSLAGSGPIGFGGSGFATGGLVQKFQAGGMPVSPMPDWLANAPDLTPEEKQMEWERLQAEQAAQEADMGGANRMWDLENIPMMAPEVESQDEYTHPIYNSEDDPSAGKLMDKVLSGAITELSPKVTKQLKMGPAVRSKVTPDQISAIFGRNPSLKAKVNELEGMSDEDILKLFTGKHPDQYTEDNIGARKRAIPVGYQDGGLISPEVAERRRRALAEHNARNRTPLLFDETLPEEEEKPGLRLFERYFGGPPGSMSLASPEGRKNFADSKAVRWATENPLEAAGMATLLVPGGALAGAAAKGTAKGVAKLFPNAIKAIKNNPKKSMAAAGLGMIAADNVGIEGERDVAELLGEGVPEETLYQAPTEAVGEVTSATGKKIPVETAKKPSFKEVEKAVVAQEQKPEEERGMNVPLIMAGIAMMTSKGDAWESIGEGFAAYLGGKEMIKKNKKDEAKEKREENLAERAMQIDEGQLDVLRSQLELEAKKLAREGGGGLTAKDIQSNITTVFGDILDAKLDSVKPGDNTDMNKMLDDSYRQALAMVTGNVSGAPKSPIQELMDAAKARAAQKQPK